MLSSSPCFSSLPSSEASLLVLCFLSGCGSTSLSEEVSLGWAKAVHSCFPGVLSPTLPSTPGDAQSSSIRGLSTRVPCCQSGVSTITECCKPPAEVFRISGFPDEDFPICMSSDAGALPPNPCKGTSINSNYSPTEGTLTLTRHPTDVSSAWGLCAGAVCAQGRCHKFRSPGGTEDAQNPRRLSSLLTPEPLSKHKQGP